TELAKSMHTEMEALRKLAQRDLPYDLDKELKQYLQDTTRRLQKLEDRARALGMAPPSADALADALAEMLRDLRQQHDELDRKVVEPLERLGAAVPRPQDAARVVRLCGEQTSRTDAAAG